MSNFIKAINDWRFKKDTQRAASICSWIDRQVAEDCNKLIAELVQRRTMGKAKWCNLKTPFLITKIEAVPFIQNGSWVFDTDNLADEEVQWTAYLYLYSPMLREAVFIGADRNISYKQTLRYSF